MIRRAKDTEYSLGLLNIMDDDDWNNTFDFDQRTSKIIVDFMTRSDGTTSVAIFANL